MNDATPRYERPRLNSLHFVLVHAEGSRHLAAAMLDAYNDPEPADVILTPAQRAYLDRFFFSDSDLDDLLDCDVTLDELGQ
jgi:hypothetical protein